VKQKIETLPLIYQKLLFCELCLSFGIPTPEQQQQTLTHIKDKLLTVSEIASEESKDLKPTRARNIILQFSWENTETADLVDQLITTLEL
jgi:hypothetical protein